MAELLRHIDRKRIFSHTLFWCCWIGGFTIIQSFGYGASDYWAWLVYYLVTLPLFIAHAYVIAYWLVPKYFFRNRYLVFAFWVFVLLVLASLGELIISNELIWKLVKPENIQPGNYLNWQNVLINGLGNEYIVIVFLSVKVVHFWTLKLEEKNALVNRKLATEIELLQFQSYPRSVLNVMDRLEKMALEGSAQTSEMIIRLSNLMSTMTATRRTDKILLHREIEMIRSYIEIQRMKLINSLSVNLLIKGELNRIKIPPFLLFQMVEEGFVILEPNQDDSDFTILIKAESNYLLFSMTIWNPEVLKTNFNPTVLENCRKYLSFFYPENHKLMSNFEINFVEITIEIYL